VVGSILLDRGYLDLRFENICFSVKSTRRDCGGRHLPRSAETVPRAAGHRENW
jgi:hypothetical protein